MALESVSSGGVTGAGGGSGNPSPSGGSPSSTPSPGSSSSAGTQPSSGSQGTGTEGVSDSQNPVEYSRFKDVNDRYTALRWAEEHDPSEVQESVQLRRWFDTDPEGAYDYLTNLMRRGGYIKSPNGNGNGNGNGQGNAGASQFTDPSTGRPLPDIVIRETGQRFYSAEQAEAYVDWKAAQLDSRLKTIEGQNTVTAVQQEARGILQDAQRNWEGFTENAEGIFQEMRRDKRITLETAYRRVVVPKLGQLKRQALIHEAQLKGQAGSGGINPGHPAPGSTTDTRKLPISELFRREMARRGMGR